MELRYILEILLRRRWIIINIFLAIVLTITIGTMLITTWYDATAKVLLRKSPVTSSLFAGLGMQGGTTSSNAIADTERSDYIALAGLRPVVETVVSDLHLKRERTRARIIRAVPFLKPLLKFLGVDVEATEEAMDASDLTESSLISNIFPRPHVEIDQYEETDIVEIAAASPDPVQATNIANELAKAFIAEELKRVSEDYKGARSFIQQNIAKTKNEYMDALLEMKKFKEREKTVNLDTETTTIIQKIADLKRGMEDSKLALFRTKAAISQVESQLRVMPKYQKDSEQIKSNEMVLLLKQSLRDLYLSLAETQTKFTSNHPAVIDIENKIAKAKDLLQKEMEKIFASETITVDPVYRDLTGKLAGYYADMAGFESQNEAYPKLISRYEAEMLGIPEKNFEQAQLNLAVTVTQDIYDSMLKYLYQIEIAETITLSNIYLVEPAIVPDIKDSKHRHPKLFLNFVIAVLLGSIFSVGAALIAEYLDDTLKTPDDVKAFKGLTFLGSIPKLKKKDSRSIQAVDPRSPMRESFRTIRNSIRFATLDRAVKSFVVTSSIQGEGKSFLAANLAISLANEGKKIILVDGDLRCPSVHKFFSVDNLVGVTNYLVGDADLKSIQVNVPVDGLTVVPTGPIPPDPARLVESRKMQQLVKNLEESFDIVIVDSPPVFAGSDSLVLGGYTDGIVIVIESGKANRKHFHDVMDVLSKANNNIIGAVLNKVSAQGAFYYYYQYGHDQ